jgi:hypothetical protein
VDLFFCPALADCRRIFSPLIFTLRLIRREATNNNQKTESKIMNLKNGRLAKALDQIIALIPGTPAVAGVAPIPAVSASPGVAAVAASPGVAPVAEVPAKVVAGTLQLNPDKPDSGFVHAQEVSNPKTGASDVVCHPVKLSWCYHAEEAFHAIDSLVTAEKAALAGLNSQAGN